MADHYSPLFASILTSTLWQESYSTRLLWVTMLALADETDTVYASVPGLAFQARITEEECREGLNRFMSPDPDSRTKEFEGRRVKAVDGGWFLLNREKHRKRIFDKKAYQRLYMRKRRSKNMLDMESNENLTEPNKLVKLDHVDVYVDVNKEKKKNPLVFTIPDTLDTPEFLKVWSDWQMFRKEIKRAIAPSTAKRQLKKLETLGLSDAIATIELSIENGWQGLFPIKATERDNYSDRCVIDHKAGHKFQVNEKGEKLWLCKACYSAMKGTPWGRLNRGQIEDRVERAKRVQPRKSAMEEIHEI
ncbi:MAG TPA: hypothetical protein VMW91_02125 [Desulfosporosinus sp.]|nr:hypothetical protein [Desulfosporosinus sp.]